MAEESLIALVAISLLGMAGQAKDVVFDSV